MARGLERQIANLSKMRNSLRNLLRGNELCYD